MSTVFSDSLHTAAKRHRCWFCDQRIEKGERYGKRAGVTDGDFWTMAYHPECDAYAREHWEYDDWECHDAGEFVRPMTAFDPVI